MKTGAVAKRFGVDPNTISDWTERFTEFSSSEARSENRKQRDYLPEDIIVLNTIRAYRVTNTDWSEIRQILASGKRDEKLPPDFVTIEGDNAITVYAEMREMRTKLETAEAEIDRLYQALNNERKEAEIKIEAERKRIDEHIQRINEEFRVERGQLNEQYQTERAHLNEQIQTERQKINEQIRLEREANQAKIEQLIRDSAVWQTRYEILQEQLREEDDDE